MSVKIILSIDSTNTSVEIANTVQNSSSGINGALSSPNTIVEIYKSINAENDEPNQLILVQGEVLIVKITSN